jgi:hypothetical protein
MMSTISCHMPTMRGAEGVCGDGDWPDAAGRLSEHGAGDMSHPRHLRTPDKKSLLPESARATTSQAYPLLSHAMSFSVSASGSRKCPTARVARVAYMYPIVESIHADALPVPGGPR